MLHEAKVGCFLKIDGKFVLYTGQSIQETDKESLITALRKDVFEMYNTIGERFNSLLSESVGKKFIATDEVIEFNNSCINS